MMGWDCCASATCGATGPGAASGAAPGVANTPFSCEALAHWAMPSFQTRSSGRNWPLAAICFKSAAVTGPCCCPSLLKNQSAMASILPIERGESGKLDNVFNRLAREIKFSWWKIETKGAEVLEARHRPILSLWNAGGGPEICEGKYKNSCHIHKLLLACSSGSKPTPSPNVLVLRFAGCRSRLIVPGPLGKCAHVARGSGRCGHVHTGRDRANGGRAVPSGNGIIMSLNNWIRAAGIEAGKNLISRSSAKRRANARGRDRRYRLSISGPIELLEGRLLLSSSVVPN